MSSLFVIAISFVVCLVAAKEARELPPPCKSEVYCHGPMLHTIQMSGLFHDSKTFVDKKLRVPPAEALAGFNHLMDLTSGNPSREELAAFIAEYFDPEGSEFEPFEPADWIANPKFLSAIKDPKLKDWGAALNDAWKFLGRKIKDDVRINPDLYSMIYVPNPVIVPGGRFREVYYWDSYWIIKGLLHSEMYTTVRGMLENLLSFIETHGLIPNGGRVYYEHRTQPPMVVPSIHAYYQKTGDLDFVRNNIHLMEKELQFWMQHRTVQVDGHTLARYNVEVGGPRPESYKEDFETAEHLAVNDRDEFYINIKTGAETGWDFSSRWFITDGASNEGNLTHIRARDIVPVDLNAFLALNFKMMAEFYEKLGDADRSKFFSKQYDTWKSAINAVLWNDEAGSWEDYDLVHKARRPYFYASNIIPLWAGCYDPLTPQFQSVVDKIIGYLENSQALQFAGGVPTSMQHSGQQWDFPNGWPPLQHMLIFGLQNTNNPRAQEMAFQIAQKWVLNNFEAFEQSLPNAMFEKYDVTVVGLPGGGGEYDVQLGFGWTNGVIMDLLEFYGDRLISSANLEQTELWPSATLSLSLGAGAALLATWLGFTRTHMYRQILDQDFKTGFPSSFSLDRLPQDFPFKSLLGKTDESTRQEQLMAEKRRSNLALFQRLRKRAVAASLRRR